MARPRLELQQLLESLGSFKVYFQPPNGTKMSYPCVVYERNDTRVQYADNNSYHRTKRYTVTVIDRNPDSIIPDLVASLPLCSHNRFFTAEDLNHDVYDLYY